MSIKAMTLNWGKCVLLVCIIPFLFACSKSKFSAVKTPPATVQDQQVDQPSPDVDEDDVIIDDDDDYNHGGPDHPCRPDCDHPCKQPPKSCPPGYEYNGRGQCVPQCEFGRDEHGRCKPCPIPPKPQCPYGEGPNGKCLPKCDYGYTNNGTCKPKPPVCQYGVGPYGDCLPKCDYGYTNNGTCKPKPPVCKNGYNEDGSCKQCNGGCEQPPKLCYEYEYNIPEYKGPRAMNVWVVMDGSKSNAAERYSQLVALVNMYERNIGRKMPITISVIAGHSKESSDSVLSGKSLFFTRGNEPAVIRLEPGMSQAKRQQAVNDLNAKIQGMETDNSNGVSDGGELLVANLFAALSPSNLARAAQMGAYGRGNILNIHFVGDENDICHPGKVEDFNKITVNGRVMSREQYAFEKNCKSVKDFDGRTYSLAPNSAGYSQALYDRLAAINSSRDAQVHLTGFIYTGEHDIPGTAADNENEIGHGMLELIRAMGGKAYDLASLKDRSSQELGGAALIGHINEEAGINPKFRLSENEHIKYSNMDTDKTVVTVDGEEVRYTVNPKNQTFQLHNCPLDGRKARIRFCVRPRK